MWHRKHGRWWMVQWCFDGWVSFGVHLDFRHRVRGDGFSYGPYIDLHFLYFIFSLGNNPLYAGEIDLLTSSAIEREAGFNVGRAIDISLLILLLMNMLETTYIAVRVLNASGVVHWGNW